MPYKEGKQWRATPQYKGERLKTKLFSTKSAASDYEREEKKKARERSLRPALDLLTFCARYLVYAERFVPKTIQEKRSLTKRLLELWGPKTAAESVTPGMVQSYLQTQAEKRSNHASNRDRKNLLALWAYGKKFCALQSNPLTDTTDLPHDRGIQYTPSTQDVLKVLAVTTRQERVFLNCYLQTAARRTEIFRWRWNDDVNFERREYRLGTRKNKDGSMRYEWFPMSEDLREGLWWLWQNRKWDDNPWVWPVEHPGPGYKRPFTQRRRFMVELCEKAGVQYFSYHALRRYVASVLADTHKVSAKTIQRVLRHSAVTTTERYIHHINQDLKGTLDLLSEKNSTSTLHIEEKGKASK
ncbi:MAG: tyrosine-type recombinase/integrase [Deltaproteobacteria bacterium]